MYNVAILSNLLGSLGKDERINIEGECINLNIYKDFGLSNCDGNYYYMTSNLEIQDEYLVVTKSKFKRLNFSLCGKEKFIIPYDLIKKVSTLSMDDMYHKHKKFLENYEKHLNEVKLKTEKTFEYFKSNCKGINEELTGNSDEYSMDILDIQNMEYVHTDLEYGKFRIVKLLFRHCKDYEKDLYIDVIYDTEKSIYYKKESKE